MKASHECVELIKRWEGFSPTPYLCPAGKWTIGYGSIQGITQHTPAITQVEATDLLLNEMGRYEASVNRLITVPLTQGQFDALVSFTFNLGGAALQRSTLRSRLNRGQYDLASDEFPKWCYAGGRKLRGLLNRRLQERDMFNGKL
jgi:lysozyme